MPRRKSLLAYGLRPSFGLWPKNSGQARTGGVAPLFMLLNGAAEPRLTSGGKAAET